MFIFSLLFNRNQLAEKDTTHFNALINQPIRDIVDVYELIKRSYDGHNQQVVTLQILCNLATNLREIPNAQTSLQVGKIKIHFTANAIL